jgi:hypothetical protein
MVHLKTTKPIESTFATVRLRAKATKGPTREGPGWPWPTSRSSRLRPVGEQSTHRPRRPVRAGVVFEKGEMVERSEEPNEEVAAKSDGNLINRS